MASALPRIYEAMYDALLLEAPLVAWLRALTPLPDAGFNTQRIWNGQAPANTPLRRLVIEQPDERSADTMGSDGNTGIVRLSGYTEPGAGYYGGALLGELLDAVLDDRPLELGAAQVLVMGEVRTMNAFREPDGSAYHTVYEYSYWTAER